MTALARAERQHHEQQLHLLKVGGGAAHQLPGRRGIEVAGVKAEEVVVQPGSQVSLDSVGDLRREPPAGTGHDGRDAPDAEDQ